MNRCSVLPCKATHATTGARQAGNLLSAPSLPDTARVDQEGHGFLVLDTPFDEIKALRFDDRGRAHVAPWWAWRRQRRPQPAVDSGAATRVGRAFTAGHADRHGGSTVAVSR